MNDDQFNNLPDLGEADPNASFSIPSGLSLDGEEKISAPVVSSIDPDAPLAVPAGLMLDEDDVEKDETEETTPDSESNSVEEVDNTPGLGTYTCPKCHAVFSTMNRMAAVRCVYCNSGGIQKVANQSLQNVFVIPFVDTIKDATSLYKSKIRFNPLIPFSFRSGKALKRMRKVYVMCSMLDVLNKGKIVFLGADKIQNVKGAPTPSYECLYSTEFEYDNLLSSNCSLLGDEIISSINDYHFTTMKEFNASMLTDSILLNGDLDKNAIKDSILQKVMKFSVNVVRGNVAHTLKKVGTNNISQEVTTEKIVCVPIYLLNLDYKGKKYKFIMNGQTGEAIVDLPMSALSILLFSLITFIIVFLLCFLAAHFI